MFEITSITDTKKHIQGLKAIVFDLDDTLYSEKEYVRSGFRAIADTFPQVNITNPCFTKSRLAWNTFSFKASNILL